jgi:glucose dehydrogenase
MKAGKHSGKKIYLVILSVLVILAMGFLIFKMVLSAPIPAEIKNSNEWPLANHDYNNSRASMDSSINSNNVGNLKLAWSMPIVGIGAFGGAASTPIISDGNIYFQDLRSNIFSLNLQTGNVNWQNIYNISLVEGPNGPAIGYGKVFIAKDIYSVAALNATTGEEIWSTTLSHVNTTGIDIQPTVYDGQVYYSTVPGTSDVFYAPGGMGIISALDQNSGKINWNFNTVKDGNLWGHPEVNSGGGSWYTPAVDTQTGSMYWGVSNPAPFPGTAAWPDGSSRPGPDLYTNSMISLNHNTGNLQWFTQVAPHDLFDYDLQIAPILATANISETMHNVVIGAGKMGKVFAFDRNTGAILWETSVGVHNENDELDRIPAGTTNTRTQPAVIGGVETPMAYSNGILFVPVVDMFTDWTQTQLNASTLNFNTGKGELVAIDVNTGKILWYKTFDSIDLGGATVANDVVFTATYDGKIFAFNTNTGNQLFTYQAPAGINAWPALTNNYIVWPAGVPGTNRTPSLIALKLNQ